MNKHIKTLFLNLFLFSSISLIAQNFDAYQEIKSSGTMPKDFITLLSDKYKEDQEQINKNDKRKSQKYQHQFYLESNFAINEIISTGNVLFNDPITNYLNSIYDNIKKDNPSLQNKNIRFYTSKSTIINAYTTHAGIIFMNIGLIAKVKTEDELAYIMCHEIAHFIKKHNIKQHTFNEEIDSEKGKYKKVDWETKMFSKANYSQQHETEADALGYELFANTKYKASAAIEALTNLKTYYLPFESDLAFSKSTFENQYISFPDAQLLPLDSIQIKEYENEQKYSTHPEVDARIEAISDQNKKNPHKDSIQTIQNKVQKIAQFEMCHLYLEKGMNYHSLYTTLALLKQDKSSRYLNAVLRKTLYALSQGETYVKHYASEDDEIVFEDFRKNYNESLGYGAKEIQQISLFFESISINELNSLATTAIWQNASSDQLSSVMKLRCEDLLEEFYKHFEKDAKSKQVVESLISQDESFASLASLAKKSSREKAKQPVSKKKSKKGVAGINRLIIISPEYRQFDLRKEKSYKYEASEKALIDYQKKIKENADKLKIRYDLLSPVSFNASDVKSINDLALLKTFLIENSVCAPNAISSKREVINELIKRYKTDKLALMGTYSFHVDKSLVKKFMVLTYTGVVFPILPLGIWYFVVPSYKTFNYAFVFDLISEELIFDNVHAINMNDSQGVINSSMYYNFMRIKRASK